ncbi:MAG: DNA replication and repair protein RecF [Magnetococcales bacterium]|nr:DNA replication and repair protein RecF [Magnetococcales bacterium]
MVLEWLRLVDFRNITQASLQFHPELNLLIGGNGQGKSNLLEAVGLLATGRSFRRSPPEVLRRHGCRGYRLQGEVRSFDLTHRLEFQGVGNRQTAQLNGKSVTMASTMDRVLAAVLLTPDSPDLVHGGPGERRDFLDWVVFSSHRRHAVTVKDYQSALKARNRLLKKNSLHPEEMDAWEDRLAVLGARIRVSRQQTLERIKESIPLFLDELGLDSQLFRLAYCGQLDSDGTDAEENRLADHYRTMLQQQRNNDHRLHTTSVGPHRDDVRFLYANRPLGRFGSRGQKKRFILALKFSELQLLQTAVQARPLLLLDDPAAELDGEGVARLLKLVNQKGQQIFMTAVKEGDFPCEHLPHQTFHVQAGQFKPLTEYPQS